MKLWSRKVKGILLLMAVVQPTQKKVRLVLELNMYMACHTRDGINMCSKVMWEWRRMERVTKILDLKSAYLQIYVDRKLCNINWSSIKARFIAHQIGVWAEFHTKKLWWQCSKWCWLKMMQWREPQTLILMIYKEAEVTAEKVRDYISIYGLTTKLWESENGAALGLKLWWDCVWCRGLLQRWGRRTQ